MITQYAPDISLWQEWKKEYRFGVLLILPPEPLLGQVNKLRARYDPESQAICDAHISLTIPLPRPIGEAEWHELEVIVIGIEQFPIRYGPLRHYLPHPGVCLKIEPQDKLSRLCMAMEKATVFSGAPERKYPFSAHMTIAEFITEDQTAALMDELKDKTPTGVFSCTSVAYAVPDANFRFTDRGRLYLAHPSGNQ